jgi:glycosyltransferase involved in cell wall biosynthesis
MRRPPISVTIIALNEGHQITKAIESVRGWAEDILVVDAGSRDDTVRMAEVAGARVIANPWPGFGKQKNFAQFRALHDWVLNIDADEQVSPELAREIDEALASVNPAQAYDFPRRNHYLGRWIRFGGWYPDRVRRLADRRHAAWSEPEVHEQLEVRGEVRPLSAPLLHFGFHSIHDQIDTNARYSKLGALELKRRGQAGSLGRLLLKPLGKFLETYWLKRGFLDGLPGFIISVNAAYSMFMKQAYLLESRMEKTDRTPRPPKPDANPHHRQ